MCLSAIGEGATNPRLNSYKNTGVSIDHVSNVLATSAIENYGESQGQRCGSVCFEGVDQHNICALILHNCETGEIIDFQCPPKGVTCPDDLVCIELKCWNTTHCKTEVDIQPTCIDPCAKCDEILVKLSQCDASVKSWKNADKSESYDTSGQSFEGLQKQYQFWLKKCRARCGKSGRRWRTVYRPNCTSA